MRKEQEDAFWQTIKAFKEIGLLQHVMIIGSWAEYLFPSLFEKSTEHKLKLNEVYKTLSVKQVKIVKQVCDENQIVLPLE